MIRDGQQVSLLNACKGSLEQCTFWLLQIALAYSHLKLSRLASWLGSCTSQVSCKCLQGRPDRLPADMRFPLGFDVS